MDTYEFLSKILPETGIYFIADQPDPKSKKVYHHACHSIQEAAETALRLDKQGKIIYHACASFQHSYIEVPDKKNGGVKKAWRTRENVQALRSFWLDVDCGAEKPYPDQTAAMLALRDFLKESGLPKPLVVKSGNGLHLYWTLTDAVVIPIWKKIAEEFKAVTVAYKFHADPMRTADASSVLRPVGSTHRKDPNNHKQVACIYDSPAVSIDEFSKKVVEAAGRKGIAPLKPKKAPASHLNDDLSSPYDSEPSDAEVLASKCQQIARFKEKGGESEPHWYAAIGVVRFCTDGDEIIHEWSAKYATYDRGETADKIRENTDRQTGPTTCATLHDRNPGVCGTCPMWGKITSPIPLGRTVVREEVIFQDDDGEEMKLPAPPLPYIIPEKGGLGVQDRETGITVLVHKYTILPIRRVYDVDNQQTTLTLQIKYPNDEPRECTMSSSMLTVKEAFNKALLEKEIYLGEKALDSTRGYLNDYLREIQAASVSHKLHTRMGWKEECTRFVVGSTVYHADGRVEDNGKIKAKNSAPGFERKGKLDVWKAVASLYNRPGMEAYQFAMCVGFAAPLTQFSGHFGAVVSLVSARGGQGKTTLQSMALSIWGDPRKLMASATDNYLPLMRRVGVACHLPVCVDEVTIKDPKWISDFAFQISQGREKERMNQDASVRDNNSEWSTLVITSSNESNISKLSSLRAGSDAEMMRYMEVTIAHGGVISKTEADNTFNLIHKNYGVAGHVYAQYLVTHMDTLESLYKAYKDKLDAKLDAESPERYWIAISALVLAGATIAKELGLVDYNIKNMYQWIVAQIVSMRVEVEDTVQSNISLLAQWVAENMGSRVLVNERGVVCEVPKNAVKLRVDRSTKLLTIPKPMLREYLSVKNGDIGMLQTELRAEGALKTAAAKRRLGDGTLCDTLLMDCFEIEYEKIGLGDIASPPPMPGISVGNVTPIRKTA